MVSSTNIFQMEYNSSLNSLGFHYSPTNAVWYGVTIPLLSNLPLNTWTHLAGTLSQEGNDVIIKFYVNGTLAATNTIINSQFADGNNDSPIYIGQTGQCPGWFKANWMRSGFGIRIALKLKYSLQWVVILQVLR